MPEVKDEKTFGGKIVDLSPGNMSGDDKPIRDHSETAEEARHSIDPPDIVGKGVINNFLRGIQDLGNKPKDRIKPTTTPLAQAPKPATGK